MRRLALLFASLAAATALAAGCGGGSEETTSPRPAAGGAAKAEVRAKWEASADCKRPPGASRWGCSVGPYRCQAVVTDRGWSVSCAKPGRSIAFTVAPRK
jgi:hypothetical protein